MVRDPLERFASAFLDKCFGYGCANAWCHARDPELSGMPIAFSSAVDWMLGSDPKVLDRHWRLQSRHCDLHRRVREYTVVGLMQKQSLHRDAMCLMDSLGLEGYDTRGPGGSNG